MNFIKELTSKVSPWATKLASTPREQLEWDLPLPAMNGVNLTDHGQAASSNPISDGMDAARQALFSHLADGPQSTPTNEWLGKVDEQGNGALSLDTGPKGAVAGSPGRVGAWARQEESSERMPPVFNPTPQLPDLDPERAVEDGGLGPLQNPNLSSSILNDVTSVGRVVQNPWGLFRDDNDIASSKEVSFGNRANHASQSGDGTLYRNKDGNIIGGSANVHFDLISALPYTIPGLPCLLDAMGTSPEEISNRLADNHISARTDSSQGLGSFQTADGKRERGISISGSTTKDKGDLGDRAAELLGKGVSPGGERTPYEINGPDAAAGLYDDGSTLTGTLQANLCSASVSEEDAPDAQGNTEMSRRFGLSEGEGYAFRLHHGDADHDGRREWGAGFDYGPISADLKTEDPLGLAAKMLSPLQFALATSGGDIGEDLSSVFSSRSRPMRNGRTLTELSGLNEAADDVVGPPKATPGVVRSPQAGPTLYGSAKEYMKSAWSSLSDTASDVWEFAKRNPQGICAQTRGARE